MIQYLNIGNINLTYHSSFNTIPEDLKKTITLIECPKLIKKKPLNRIDLFFEHTQDMNERLLIIKTSGRLKNYEF